MLTLRGQHVPRCIRAIFHNTKSQKYDVKIKNMLKSFPSHKTHKAALISVFLCLSQTPVYTARQDVKIY